MKFFQTPTVQECRTLQLVLWCMCASTFFYQLVARPTDLVGWLWICAMVVISWRAHLTFNQIIAEHQQAATLPRNVRR